MIKEFRVGDILQLERTLVEIYPDDLYTPIGIRSFGRGIINYPPTPGEELSKLRYFRFPPNALAISNIKAWEGALALTPSQPGDAVASNRFLFYTPQRDEVDVRYLRYYFLSEKGLAQIGKASPGSADRNRTLGIKSFEALKIPLPDVEEQRRITARLDDALAKLEQAEKLREHRTKLCAALAESTVARAVNESTQSLRVGSALSASRTPIEIEADKEYQALGMRSFGRGTIRYPPAKGRDLSKLRYFRFPSGVLALSNIKAWEGAISIVGEEDTACVASNRFLFYSPTDERINIRYLKHYLLSRQGLAQISACSPGSADRNRTLSIKRFENLEIPLPKRDEQDRIARLLDAVTENVRPEMAHEKQAALRPSLLNKAFSGQL